VIAFYELWSSGDALRGHLAQPRMQAFLARRMELLAEDLEISFFRPIELPGQDRSGLLFKSDLGGTSTMSYGNNLCHSATRHL
jgi:hypothetical protein